MADLLNVDVDAASVLRALDRLGPAAEKHTFDEARVTARKVQSEAKSRVRRLTGQTAEHILVEETERDVRVIADPSRAARKGRAQNVPLFLEFGTVRASAFPFFFAAADLERGGHRRRTAEALERAIAEAGG